MAFTYSKLADTTVGVGGASTITFNNIPQNYTDLVVKVSGRSTNISTARGIFIAFNSSPSGYTDRFVRGSGSTVTSATNNGGGNKIYLGEATASDATANTFSNIEIYIPNYAGSTNKSISIDSVQEHNATEAYATLVAGLLSNVTAIISLSLTTSLNLAQHSTATLYGIRVEL
jgi:hypothetical protein